MGSFDREALIFKIARSCMRCFKCDVIQGDIEARTRTLRSEGGMPVNYSRKDVFPCTPHTIRVVMGIYAVPTLHTNIITKFSTIKIFEIPVANCALTAIDQVNCKFTINIYLAMITNADMSNT